MEIIFVSEKKADSEYEYELVECCKKFMKDFNDVSKQYVYNPFTDRKVKKGSSTYGTIYHQVKRYLENLDDEEFHSPLKINDFKVDIVPASEMRNRDIYLSRNVLATDRVDNDWHKKFAKKLRVFSECKEIIIDEGFNLTTWKYDSPIMSINDDDFEGLKMKWIENNPELYSFLDVYKPELFKNKYLMKHLLPNEFNYNQFTQWLQTSADSFLRKTYESYSSTIANEKRYPVSMIMFWIYQPLILHARKYLKKHKKKIDDMIQKKPLTQVKITKQQLSSVILAFFIRSTKVENLEKIKSNYELYFENTLKDAIQMIERENIISRPGYRQLFTEFMAARIRPYRYTNLKIGDLENFDKIVGYLNNPPKLTELLKIDNTSKEEISDDE
jgi:hypothetical protein